MRNFATKSKAVALMIAIGLAIGGCEKARLDEQVRELCAKDGGIKVYETVTLPADKFDAYARTNWILPDKMQAKPTDDYFTVTDTRYYRTGNPEMSRRQYQIIRRSDGKVLGELVIYGRGGGDLPGPWMDSTYHCPPYGKSLEIETQVFQRGSH
jgi:hypothetical protein